VAYFGCICLFVFFCLQVSQNGPNDDQCLFVLFVFLGSKLCVFLCKLSNTIEKFMSRSDKRVFCLFLFNWKWEMMPTFLFRFFVLFLSFWLFGSKLILLDWRLQDYYGNFGKVSSRQGLQSYHKLFFEWIIWWWS